MKSVGSIHFKKTPNIESGINYYQREKKLLESQLADPDTPPGAIPEIESTMIEMQKQMDKLKTSGEKGDLWDIQAFSGETQAMEVGTTDIGRGPPRIDLDGKLRFTEAEIRKTFGDGVADEIVKTSEAVSGEPSVVLNIQNKHGDVEVGGTYGKFIYDKILTEQAKKIGKKHGAKVEEGSIGSTELINDYQAHINKLQKRLDEEQLPKRTRSDFKHAIEYHKERLLEERENIKKVWSMRLTDKLKQASKDGMPYYVALPPLVMGAAAQRTDAQRQQSKTDAQAILTQ